MELARSFQGLLALGWGLRVFTSSPGPLDPRACGRALRTAAGKGPHLSGGLRSLYRERFVLGPPRSLGAGGCTWPALRAAGGRSSALRWGSCVSGRSVSPGAAQVLCGQDSHRPQGSSAVRQGGSQPSRRWAARPSGPQGSSEGAAGVWGFPGPGRLLPARSTTAPALGSTGRAFQPGLDLLAESRRAAIAAWMFTGGSREARWAHWLRASAGHCGQRLDLRQGGQGELSVAPTFLL